MVVVVVGVVVVVVVVVRVVVVVVGVGVETSRSPEIPPHLFPMSLAVLYGSVKKAQLKILLS